MPTLTKDSVKNHCRTCLTKLIEAKGAVCVLQNKSAASPSDEAEECEMLEFKDICINIASNSELRQLLTKYVQLDESHMTIYPAHMCFRCYDKLRAFEKFWKLARDCAEKLNALFGKNSVTKVEIDYNGGDVEQVMADASNKDSYQLLDSLMETESVLLDRLAVATLVGVEMHDIPDPFDSTSPSKNLYSTGELIGGEEDGGSFDQDCWQRSLISPNMSESSKLSQSEKRGKSKDVYKNEENYESEEYLDADTDDDDRRLALRSEKEGNSSVCEKKKERRKSGANKEMEEHRRAETDNFESTNKRRNKNSFKCTQCNHCFAHKITLEAHVRKVHEGSKRPFQCDLCDKSYAFIGGLYAHIKEIHKTKVRSYSCDHTGCGRIYTNFISMQKHKRAKHTEIGVQKKYICEQCGGTFDQSGNLKYHRRTKHPTDAEKAETECKFCQKCFHSRYTLNCHILQMHSNDMKYECNICSRRMAKKFMLVQHMLIHSTEKLPCEHCGKRFARKFELGAHIRAVHMKLKPFKCQYCSECFALRKTLRHHEYIHTGEKPYVCDICGKAYRQQTCLKNHRKMHEKLSSGENPVKKSRRTKINKLLSGPPQSTRQQPQSQQTTANLQILVEPVDPPFLMLVEPPDPSFLMLVEPSDPPFLVLQ